MTTNGTDTDNNLYSLHDFDIDLDVSLPGEFNKKPSLTCFLQCQQVCIL
jgi:hypothetical protein